MIHSEIEIKLPLHDRPALVSALEKIGARFVEHKQQRDVLCESPVVDFSKVDQALRVRIEISTEHEVAYLTFKGTPSFTAEGHKVRDEFETVIDSGAADAILKALGFTPALMFKKTRDRYEYDGVYVEIDECDFGTFVEIEGESRKIEVVRQKLGLQEVAPVRESYAAMQHAWDQRSRELPPAPSS